MAFSVYGIVHRITTQMFHADHMHMDWAQKAFFGSFPTRNRAIRFIERSRSFSFHCSRNNADLVVLPYQVMLFRIVEEDPPGG